MKVFNLNKCSSSPAPMKWQSIPEIIKAQPKKEEWTVISLRKLDNTPDGVLLARWYGAKKGEWKPCSDIFIIM